MARWEMEGKLQDARAWAVVRSWAAVKSGEQVDPADHFPFLGEQAEAGGEDLLFGLIGEDTEDDTAEGVTR